jgi:hypothetical protein
MPCRATARQEVPVEKRLVTGMASQFEGRNFATDPDTIGAA